MLLWRLKNFITLTAVLALLVGCGTLAYARWSRPLLEGDAALDAGDTEQALAEYGEAEARFRWLPLTQQLFPDDYARAVHNQLVLFYESGEYDAVIAKADTAPAGATPRVWTGYALFSLADAETKPERRLVLLTRAAGEFKQALEAAPDDWDTKYNYEVTARLADQLRREPSSEPDTLMQLLRPTQKGPRAVRKRG